MSLIAQVAALSTASAIYTISGETDITIVRGGGGNIIVGIIVNDATYGGLGTIAKVQEGSSGQIDAATDWCIPNSSAGSKQAWMRATITGVGDPLDTSSNGAGTWYRVDAGSEIRYTVSTADGNPRNFEILLELSFDNGSTVYDSATYSGLAQNA